MAKAKEKKIRDALKHVYSLYSEVNDFVFTTFNYEPDFFEEHIVGFLMGIDKRISTIGELNDADKWVRDNHISVYYDKGALSIGTTCLTVPSYPQNVDGGVFHPKVVVIYGKLKKEKMASIHMIVSSCNLTISGYARNKEAFACVQVNTRRLAENLLYFVRSLKNGKEKKHEGLIEYLENTRFKHLGDVEFVWSRGDEGVDLIKKINEFPVGDLIVVSPYYDKKGPLPLLIQLRNKGKTTIVPAIDGESYNIYKNDYLSLKDFHNINFASLSRDVENRFIHAKIIQLGKKTIVGSYNFTEAAMRGRNAEAALIFDNSSNLQFDLQEIDEERFLLQCNEIECKDEVSQENGSIFVTVTINWKLGKAFVVSEGLNKVDYYSLKLDGRSNDFISSLEGNECISLDLETSKHLLKHKFFTVYKNAIACFKGLINEIDSENYRPEFACESLNESIKEWFLFNDKKNSDNKRLLRSIDLDDEETEKILNVYEDDNADIFDNYFLVAKAFENLRKQIRENIPKSCIQKPIALRKTEKFWEKYNEWKNQKFSADQKIYGALVTKPGSIENMLQFLQNDLTAKNDKDVVFTWLVAHYINLILAEFPSNLKNNAINNLYKEKKQDLSEKAKEIEQSIKKKMKVGRLYWEWIEQEMR